MRIGDVDNFSFVQADPFDQMTFLGKLSERELSQYVRDFRGMRNAQYADAWCAMAVAVNQRLIRRLDHEIAAQAACRDAIDDLTLVMAGTKPDLNETVTKLQTVLADLDPTWARGPFGTKS